MLIKRFAGVSMLFAVLTAGAALPVMAQTPTSTGGPSSGVNVTCVQAAVEKRDSALITVWDTYSAAVRSALSTRKDALKAAWGLSGKAQSEALKEAWKAYTNSVRDARKNAKKGRQNAWAQFKRDRKSCGAASDSVSEPGGGEGADSFIQ